MTFLKTVKITTLTLLLLLLLFTNNSYAIRSDRELQFNTIFDAFDVRCLNWDNDTQSLYFSGGHSIYRYDYNENRVYQTKIIDQDIYCVLAVDSKLNTYAIAIHYRIEIWEWDGRSENYQVLYTLFELPEVAPHDNSLRFNTFVADRKGRFYGGTGVNLKKNYGCFYMWEIGMQTPMKQFCELTDFMGGAFDYPNKKFYYVDSALNRIDVFDYDEASGALTNRKVLYDFEVTPGTYPGFKPNGVVLDTNGLMLIPAFDGYKIFALDPVKQKIVRDIDIKCKEPSAVVFGGPKLNYLFVGTTKKFKLEPPCGEGYAIACFGSSGLILSKLKIN